MVEASFSTPKLQYLHKAAAALTVTTDSPHRPPPSGLISTPPLQTPPSVPFKWEEEPGKPRLCTSTTITTQPQPSNSKCLDLPPACRMLLFMDNHAPPTLDDGPYNVGRPKSSSFRFFREGQDSLSLDSGAAASGGGGQKKARGSGFFGKKLRSGGKRVVDGGGISEFFWTTSGSGSSNRCDSREERMKMEMDGVGRKMGRHEESFTGVAPPHASNNKSSHIMIWATIYQGLKQVVQWKSSRKPNQKAAAQEDSH